MTDPLERKVVEALFSEHRAELLRFLVGVLRDSSLAEDVLQAAFAKLIDQGGASKEDSRKAWLFRVAYNEALALRRREAVDRKAKETVAWSQSIFRESECDAAHRLIQGEDFEAIRDAINRLPDAERQVLHMRIHEEKTFARISAELAIPLGTALGRMRSALARLRSQIRELGSDK